jgi:hypothetical protein
MSTYEKTTESAAVTAINIFDGLALNRRNEQWNNLQPAWEHAGMGFVEFCSWIARIGEASEDKLAALNPQDFPGVYDYEVSYPLGQDIAKYMFEHVRLPSDEEVDKMLDTAINEFFAQGVSNDAHLD